METKITPILDAFQSGRISRRGVIGVLTSLFVAAASQQPALSQGERSMGKNLKKAISEGQVIIGGYAQTSSIELVEIIGQAGFDFVILSSEDTPYDYETRSHQVDVARLANLATIIRPAANDPVLIRRALDLGIDGLNVPLVNTAEEASNVVKAAMYYPQGERGMNAMARMANYGADYGPDYFKRTNERTLITILIETKQAGENIEEIAQVEGIDVLYMGPTDLSNSLGVPGQPKHPLVEESTNQVLAAAKKHGIAVANVIYDPFNEAEIVSRVEQGYQVLSVFLDVALFQKALYQLHDKVHEVLKRVR